MNKLTKSVAGLMLALSAFSFSSCDDETDVIGLNDATKYGYIKLKFEGERPDGEDFESTKNFRFIPANDPLNNSYLDIGEDGDLYYSFYAFRTFDAFDANGSNFANLQLNFSTPDGESDFNYYNSYVNVTTFFTSKADHTAFYINTSLPLDEDAITSYSYNEKTGKLSLKFEVTLSGQENQTGNELTVTGEIRTTVFTRLNYYD